MGKTIKAIHFGNFASQCSWEMGKRSAFISDHLANSIEFCQGLKP